LFYFYNNGDEQIYLSSADMMQRNLDRRVEIAFPVEDAKLKREIMKTLIKVSLKDNVKARELLPNLTFQLIKSDDADKKINSQEWLMNHTLKASGSYKKSKLKF